MRDEGVLVRWEEDVVSTLQRTRSWSDTTTKQIKRSMRKLVVKQRSAHNEQSRKRAHATRASHVVQVRKAHV